MDLGAGAGFGAGGVAATFTATLALLVGSFFTTSFFATCVSVSSVCTISSGGTTFVSRPITSDVINTVAPTISNPIVASFHWLGEMSAIDILLFLKTLHFSLFLH